MGGKKKKSAAAAAPVAPVAGAAAAGNSVAEEPKKQPHSNKPAKPAKENKSKGAINYLPAWKLHSSVYLVCVCVIAKIKTTETPLYRSHSQAETQRHSMTYL